MSVADRKSEELAQKAAAFGAEVDDWLKERRGQSGFRVHSSQLDAIEAVLAGLRQGIAAELKAAVEQGAVLPKAVGIENMILSGYQVWDFYRPKLGQRLETQFQRFLRIADEFAWACYKPFRDAIFGDGPEAKEPPLVYLNADWSPFVKERNREYQVDSVPQALLTRQPDFAKAVARLPFPVIGVPWFQAGFLPAGLTIAHEVGHAVVADGGLQARLVEGMAVVADAQRRAQWEAWSEEMFADMFGCISVGPSFCSSLADTLAADRATVNAAQEAQYPPHSLRIKLNSAMLRRLGHQKAADDLWTDWSQQYQPPYPWSDYESDVDAVAAALLAVRVARAGGEPCELTKLLWFTPDAYAAADQFAKDTEQKIAGKRPEVRGMWAGARISYERNPALFTSAAKGQTSIAERFTDRMRAACLDNLRAGEGPAHKGRRKYLESLGGEILSAGSKPE